MRKWSILFFYFSYNRENKYKYYHEGQHQECKYDRTKILEEQNKKNQQYVYK